MGARLARKLRTLAIVVSIGLIGSFGFSIAQGFISAIGLMVGLSYGLLLSVTLGSVTLFLCQGPMRGWLAGLSLTADVAVRSAIYAAIIIPTEFFQLGALLVGQSFRPSIRLSWVSSIYDIAFVILFNLALAIVGLIGPRSFLNFVSGRYHRPVQETRFVLFVDIVGSTGLAEPLGGVGFLARASQPFEREFGVVPQIRGSLHF